MEAKANSFTVGIRESQVEKVLPLAYTFILRCSRWPIRLLQELMRLCCKGKITLQSKEVYVVKSRLPFKQTLNYLLKLLQKTGLKTNS